MMRVAVVGAGTMGHGIAQIAAQSGCTVTLTDARPDALPKALTRIGENLNGAVDRKKLSAQDAEATMARISTSPDAAAAAAGADLVVEAIVEDLAVKSALFQVLDRAAPADAILATNTSALSVARIAAATTRPSRVIGMHFFNPVHIMKLVEVVTHDGVADHIVQRTRDAAMAFGKEPIVVRDTPGFASSRLGVILGLEAMRMVEQGVASPADIDKAMELGYGHPMGPLRVSDMVGLDVRLAIADYLHSQLKDAQYAPPEILRKKVKAGELGKKTGKGFHEWEKPKSS
ncbi:MAG TPA: 3-hydroxyacyl-CoA dehydrogenase family protein [Gemmatimonadales bacterium]